MMYVGLRSHDTNNKSESDGKTARLKGVVTPALVHCPL